MAERNAVLADLALLGVTAVWGATFVTMKNLLASTPPLTILFWRFSIAFGALVGFSCPKGKRVFLAGTILGGALFGGYLFQTLGLLYVTPARSAFVTGLCTVIVPLFAFLILRTKPDRILPLSIALALFGLFILSLGGERGNTVFFGDFLTLLGATAYALQIVLVERFTEENSAFALATVEMGVAALLSLSFALFLEEPLFPRRTEIWGSLFFLGIVATALAFSVQKVAQRYTEATHVGIIFISEPVFAALFSYFLWHERLTARSILGCSLILLGILTTQLRLSPGAPSLQLSAQTQDPQGREGR
ncbi:MAG: DMT family transporter [Candidatus Caldatribacterium sp.]|nr:DMT family transporter [Candidatus Caldatribacterium sp.]